MRKVIAFTIFILTLTFIATGASCSSSAQKTNSSNTQPVIRITYSAAFQGEAPSGYLNLVIDMTIENMGYKSFDTSPSNFLVKVNDYSYKAKQSNLETLDLPDRAKVQGKITFNVPPQAKKPGIGFKLVYSEQISQNIHWIESLETSNSESQTRSLQPTIDIAYSTDFMWLPSPGTQDVKVKYPGNLYLVVEMTIQNNGYESFYIKPEYFSVVATSAIGNVEGKMEKALIDWREIEIKNNGRYTGSLVFRVPTEIAQSFYQWNYNVAYKGIRAYDVRWRQLQVSEYEVDPEETELEAVFLTNGSNITGKLAYSIDVGLASNNASYEMLYDEETNHNVQWFNQPGSVADIDRNPISYPVIKITYSTSLVKRDDIGRLFLMVDVLIENRGYVSFLTSPGHFLMEVSY